MSDLSLEIEVERVDRTPVINCSVGPGKGGDAGSKCTEGMLILGVLDEGEIGGEGSEGRLMADGEVGGCSTDCKGANKRDGVKGDGGVVGDVALAANVGRGGNDTA